MSRFPDLLNCMAQTQFVNRLMVARRLPLLVPVYDILPLIRMHKKQFPIPWAQRSVVQTTNHPSALYE